MAPGDMLFIDHVKELRNRLLRIIVITIAIMIFCTVFGIQLVSVNSYSFYFLMPTVYNNIASQVTLFLSKTLIPSGVELIQTAPGQSLYAQIYVAILISVSCSIPLIVREVFGFISPAMSFTGRKKTFLAFLLPTTGLFICGMALAIPITLTFLYQYGESIGVLTFLNISDFINFVLQFFIAFGISFQLPLVMAILSSSGLVNIQFWLKNFKYAVLIIIIFGALITPDGSGITMWFISIPMLLLYVIGIAIIKLRNRTKVEVQ
jgi:sec-independent protein translocase protein TatC